MCIYFHRKSFTFSLINQGPGSILGKQVCTKRKKKKNMVCDGVGLHCSRSCVESQGSTHSRSTVNTLNGSHWLPWNVFFRSNFSAEHTTSLT